MPDTFAMLRYYFSLVRDSSRLIEGLLQLVQGLQVLGLAAEEFDDFCWCAELVEGVDLEHLDVFDVLDAFVGVFVQQSVQYFAGLFAILGEYVALSDLLRALGTGERRLIEGGVADHIEDIHLLANGLFQVFQYDTLFGQLVDDGLLFVGAMPSVEEVIQ